MENHEGQAGRLREMCKWPHVISYIDHLHADVEAETSNRSHQLISNMHLNITSNIDWSKGKAKPNLVSATDCRVQRRCDLE